MARFSSISEADARPVSRLPCPLDDQDRAAGDQDEKV